MLDNDVPTNMHEQGTRVMKRLIREPLVHFLLLAALVFAAYSFVAGRDHSASNIDISRSKIEQLAGLFVKTWQRPPTPEDMKGLIDDYVKEEIYVREALRLGLDADDPVIRKRLRMKMEFIGDAEAEANPPTDVDLQAYLDTHQEDFRKPPQIALEQIYISTSKHGTGARAAAEALLAALNNNPALAETAGDATLLPPSLPLTDQQDIAQIFGNDFAAAVINLAPGEWQGPFSSTVGLHLVKPTKQLPGSLPRLAEIRQQVEREWMNARRNTSEQQRFEGLRKQYNVTIEPVAPSGTTPP